MPRRSRRSSLDTLLQRALYAAIAALALLIAAAILIEERPVLALVLFCGVPLIGVAAAASLWQRRRLARTREARMRLLQAQRLGDLLTMSGSEFEATMAELFTALGYRDVEHIGGSGDLGVDLIATDAAGTTVVIQCKRYGRGNKVGSPAVQSLMGTVVNRGANRGIFVTTSVFTAPAIQLAATARVPITLIDGAEITRLAGEAVSRTVGDGATGGGKFNHR